jgi:hypothetical protein
VSSMCKKEESTSARLISWLRSRNMAYAPTCDLQKEKDVACAV